MKRNSMKRAFVSRKDHEEELFLIEAILFLTIYIGDTCVVICWGKNFQIENCSDTTNHSQKNYQTWQQWLLSSPHVLCKDMKDNNIAAILPFRTPVARSLPVPAYLWAKSVSKSGRLSVSFFFNLSLNLPFVFWFGKRRGEVITSRHNFQK